MKSSRRLLLVGVGILAAGMMSLGIYIALLDPLYQDGDHSSGILRAPR